MNEVDLGWYEGKLKINRHALDDELTEQPELYYHCASQAVGARSRADEAKEVLRATDADLSMTLRAELEGKGEKVTEARLTAAVQSHDKHAQAYKNLNQHIYEAEQWSALRDAFLQRSYALKDLAGLYAANYYASSSVHTPATREVAQDTSDNARTKMADARKRKLTTK